MRRKARAGRLGRRGEWFALCWFLLRGYRPRHRNWRGGGGEIDLVLSRGPNIVFVEVKSRSSPGYGGGLAAVDTAKQRALIRAASAYLSRYDLWERPVRFDVLLLEQKTGSTFSWKIVHVQDAFHADPRIMAS